MGLIKKIFGGSYKRNSYTRHTKLDLEKLVLSDDLNSSIIELDNYIGELCSYGDDMDKLSHSQKLFYYNQCLEREVNNGGFDLYFFNSSGSFAMETVRSLQAIGANKTAMILQKAIDQFPNKKVPEDRDERQVILEKIHKIAAPIWKELDQQFFTYEDDLNALNMEYVRQHVAAF